MSHFDLIPAYVLLAMSLNQRCDDLLFFSLLRRRTIRIHHNDDSQIANILPIRQIEITATSAAATTTTAAALIHGIHHTLRRQET